MRKIILIALLALSGCAGVEAARTCQDQAGPQPYAFANLLGLPGLIVVNQTDERQAWYKSVDDCMARWRAANP